MKSLSTLTLVGALVGAPALADCNPERKVFVLNNSGPVGCVVVDSCAMVNQCVKGRTVNDTCVQTNLTTSIQDQLPWGEQIPNTPQMYDSAPEINLLDPRDLDTHQDPETDWVIAPQSMTPERVKALLKQMIDSQCGPLLLSQAKS